MSNGLTKENIWGLLREFLDEDRSLQRKSTISHEINLPNLRVQGVNIAPAQQPDGSWNVQIDAGFENVGRRSAAECDAVATVSVLRPPFSQNSVQTFSCQARCPALGPHSFTLAPIQFCLIPNLPSRSVVNVHVCVDPPTPNRPGGEIWESNEEDNCKDDGVFLEFAKYEDIDIPPDPEVPKQR